MASRSKWAIFLYLSAAVSLAIILLFYANPTLPTATKSYFQSIVGSSKTEEPVSEAPSVSSVDVAASIDSSTALLSDATVADIEPPETAAISVGFASALSSAFTTVTGASRSPFPSSSTPSSAEAASASATETERPKTFNDDSWWFQDDLKDYALPDIGKLRHLAPHNYAGPGHRTYATMFTTRNATLHDPFFLSTLQIIYRLLWDPRSKSEYPVTVFVTPFISDDHRKYFSAAGALVREVALIPFDPGRETFGRWRDMFSKLEMWKQTDFSDIAYLDSDAFPVNHTDSIFDAASVQQCKKDRLPKEDKAYASSICKYVFAGVRESKDYINAGVMVFKPNRAMYDRLMRSIYEKANWDPGLMEQAYLNHAFRPSGPFPFKPLPKLWNAPREFRTEGKEHRIVHDKMWSHVFDDPTWVMDHYNQTWSSMLALYESEEFVKLRNKDQELSLSGA